MKLAASIFGYITGAITPVIIDWGHIAEKVIETSFVSFFGGALGAAGGILLAWALKKYFKIEKK